MQLRQPSPDAVVSFSDFLLERFGLVASMQVALVASIAFHVFVVIGLGFKMIPMPKWDAPHNVLDVVLVNSKSASRPEKADALAQANLDGGGNTDEKRRASSPFPTVDDRDPAREMKAAEARRQQLEAEAQELMTRMKSKAAVANVEVAPPGTTSPTEEAKDLVQKSLEIARLEAQIRRDYQAYQERPKRKFVGARAQEYRFAQYVDTWRLKIERIGNLNYPDSARGRIYGSLRLTISIKPDGSVEDVQIDRPADYKVLNDAALKIIRLAAPFAPFPAEIRKDTDLLVITRTWTFAPGDRLFDN